MADIGHEHLHHMAKRLHHTNSKLAGIQDTIRHITHRARGGLEVAAGAWLGGAVEGYSGGAKFLHVPVNLLAGFVALGLGNWPKLAGNFSDDLNNLGNGLIASYTSAVGYSYGKNVKATGKWFGGHSWTSPYELPGGAKTGAELSEAQMASIVSRMQQAAGQGAHP